MVHNGIEYGDMQLICEAYHLMKDCLGMSQDEMAEVSLDNYGIFVFNTPPHKMMRYYLTPLECAQQCWMM